MSKFLSVVGSVGVGDLGSIVPSTTTGGDDDDFDEDFDVDDDFDDSDSFDINDIVADVELVVDFFEAYEGPRTTTVPSNIKAAHEIAGRAPMYRGADDTSTTVGFLLALLPPPPFLPSPLMTITSTEYPYMGGGYHGPAKIVQVQSASVHDRRRSVR